MRGVIFAEALSQVKNSIAIEVREFLFAIKTVEDGRINANLCCETHVDAKADKFLTGD